MKHYIFLLILMLGVTVKNINYKELPLAKYFIFSISTLILVGGLGLVMVALIHAIAPNGLIH